MIQQRYKDAYFMLIRPVLRLNHYWHKYVPLRHSSHQGKVCLHLGCGDKYFSGFVNIDGNVLRKVDVRLDIRNGLPWASNSVDFIYCCGVLEHFFPDELEFILRECYRVLRPGCGMRIVVPNLRSAIEAYMRGKREWFDDWPRSYKSLGGRFANFILCDGQHRNAFDFDYFNEVLGIIKFSKVIEQHNGRSFLYDETFLTDCEPEPDPDLTRSLYIECIKGSSEGVV